MCFGSFVPGKALLPLFLTCFLCLSHFYSKKDKQPENVTNLNASAGYFTFYMEYLIF